MSLTGYIKSGLYYRFHNVPEIAFIDFDTLNISKQAKFLTEVEGSTIAVCRWTSPKRTRTYPYARIYDILSQDAQKKVAIIPLVKDEGRHGDRDYLQWDTVALLSLLGVYVIPAYYCDAERKGYKLTNQKLEESYVKSKLLELASYRNTPLHWNIKELRENLDQLIERVKDCYSIIAECLGVQMHGFSGLDSLKRVISEGLESFIQHSRRKAIQAQLREKGTQQPKERLTYGRKVSIDITNYLGGVYHFTVDEFFVRDETAYLIESKHSRHRSLPNIEDVKDGLIKVMLFKAIDELYLDEMLVSFKVGLKLTSEVKEHKELSKATNSLKNHKVRRFYEGVLKEAEDNHFEVFYNGIY